MSKVIYLYNQDNLSSNDKLYKIILDFFKSINQSLIIQFFNYFFNNCICTKDSISINVGNLNSDKNSYIPLDSSLPSINFTIGSKYMYSIEIVTSIRSNFSLHLLKYNLTTDIENSYIISLPEVKILEFEDKYLTEDKFNYVMKIYTHSLSYEIPVIKLFKCDFNYLKDKGLFILFPFKLFSIYNKVLSTSKIGPYPVDLKKEILDLSENTYKNIKELNLYNTYLNRNDYTIIKDTIGKIVDYYLDSISN